MIFFSSLATQQQAQRSKLITPFQKHVFVMYVIRYFIFERLQALASAHFPTLLVLRSIPVPFSHSIMIYSLFHPLMVSWSCHDTNVPLQKITLFILIECKKHPLHSQPCAAEAGETKPNELHANLGKWRTAIFSKQKLTASFLILFEAPTDSFLKTRLLCPQR